MATGEAIARGCGGDESGSLPEKLVARGFRLRACKVSGLFEA